MVFKGLPIAVGIAQGIMLGTTLLIMRMFGSGTNSLAYTWSFLAIANVLLLLFFVLSHKMHLMVRSLGKWRTWVAVGMVNSGIQLCTVKGVTLAGAAHGSVLVRTDLLFGLLLASIIYKEKTHWQELLGGLIMVWGVLLVMQISARELHGVAIGDLYLLMAGLLTAVNAVMIKYGLAGVWGPTIAYFNTLVASLTLGIALLVTGDWRTSFSFIQPQLAPWLFLAGINYATSLLAYYFTLARFPIWITRSFALISPIVAILGGWLWFDEQLSGMQVFGAVIVMCGMVIMLAQRRAKEAATEDNWSTRHQVQSVPSR